MIDYMPSFNLQPITFGEWREVTLSTDSPRQRFIDSNSRRLCLLVPVPILPPSRDEWVTAYPVERYILHSVFDRSDGFAELIYAPVAAS